MIELITFVLNICSLMVLLLAFWNLFKVMKKDPFTGERVIDRVIRQLISR